MPWPSYAIALHIVLALLCISDFHRTLALLSTLATGKALAFHTVTVPEP